MNKLKAWQIAALALLAGACLFVLGMWVGTLM
jgi:uncharacterized membrane protein YiaA